MVQTVSGHLVGGAAPAGGAAPVVSEAAPAGRTPSGGAAAARRAGMAPADVRAMTKALDEARVNRFHARAVIVSGAGFFTDAYDLFVISTVATLAAAQWHLSTTQTSWVSGSAILGAFVGAIVFGRLADRIGRRAVYLAVAAIMIGGAIASALAPTFLTLTAARFVLGLGVGGDYPVSAVLMSEYSNRDDRGRLVSMVFSMQALGLVVGPLVALGLLGSGIGDQLTWRLLLGLGAVPAAAVIYLRSKMPESPRFEAANQERAARSPGVAPLTRAGSAAKPGRRPHRAPGLLDLLRDRHYLRLLLGTAGSWFVFDYAYYGNTLSLPQILKGVDPGADLTAKLAWSLAMFVVFAVPGYALAVWALDRVGHRRLQSLGFGALAAAFGLMAAVPVLTGSIGAFVAIFGLSYFFVEFGPNTTTFVLPSEVFPVSARTTGHGASAGLGKLGAFVGVFIVPTLETDLGLRGMLAIAAACALAGVLLTRLLPEPARRSLEDLGTPRPPAEQPTARPGQLVA